MQVPRPLGSPAKPTLGRARFLLLLSGIFLTRGFGSSVKIVSVSLLSVDCNCRGKRVGWVWGEQSRAHSGHV